MNCLLFLNILFVLFSCHVDCTILHTRQGTLEGKTELSRGGSSFYAFYKIPYAEPPIGDLRFENPVPAKTWNGVRDATVWPPDCLSHHNDTGILGQEDCLYLNVYTPKITNDSFLPVMVFIVGGRFMYSSASPTSYGPQYFMDEDVVLVTFNHRLGFLGFLSTEDDVIPGNYGLKDFVAVLHWVQNYIEAFGGDKNRVTLFGGSSGGATASWALISPLTKGLFHRVISQSGYPTVLEKPGFPKRSAWKFASMVGCDEKNVKTSSELLTCLKKLPAKEIVEYNSQLYTLGYLLPELPWSPVIESEKVPGAFLVDDPRKLLSRKSDIPWIVGMNRDEGGMLAIFSYFNRIGKVADELEKDYKKYFPLIFQYDHQASNSQQLDHITEIYKKYYFGDRSIREGALELSKMGTYMNFYIKLKEVLALYKGPKYLYYYDHKNEQTFGHMYGEFEEDMGIIHGDELISMFNWSSVITPVTEGIDLVVSKQVLRLWTNFAAKGDPNDDDEQLWHPVNSPDLNYLHIRNGSLEMKNQLFKSEFEFLENAVRVNSEL